MTAAKPIQLRLMPGATSKTGAHRDVHGKAIPHVANMPRVVPLEPGWVQEDAIAHREWLTVTALLSRVRLLHDASAAPVGAYCIAVSRLVAAQRGHREGTVSSREVSEHDRSMRAWAGRLGLDPAGESVLAAAAQETP